jgi:TonB family protein
MSALIYRSNQKWRFGAALAAAALIHVGAIGFATQRDEPQTAFGSPSDSTFIEFEPLDPSADPREDPSGPLPPPPVIDEFYVESTATPPPVRRQNSKSTPIVRPPTGTTSRALTLSTAKVLALNAPRPEYPYEARRQKITGDGVALMSVDSVSGNVTRVTMAKSTGSAFLDNAAIVGFKRWRFKPGSVSAVTCPVTFTLSGASY